MKARELIDAVGPDAARTLAELFGGTRHDMPGLEAVTRAAVRNAAIAAGLAAGHTYAAIARRHGITSRQVRNIERAMRLARNIVK